MLYETCARTDELLGINIEDLDLPGRCAPVKSKGAKPRTRRRGATHHEHVLETVYWDAGTARLLPRLIRDRTHGPIFLTHRKPGPGKYLTDRDVCPDTGRARLSYDQARDLLDAATATAGPGTRWDLHELRHSSLAVARCSRPRDRRPLTPVPATRPQDHESWGLVAPGMLLGLVEQSQRL
ncbi:hypothetical protein [Nocardia sp. NPDC049707]|uniref:hypothetical protein n=1 Tax=Nocardia sp. NPDC049707 TaxID=3154735 RepID=UPI00341581FD